MTDADRRRFERIYAEQFDRVSAYALSRADRQLAEDAVARTFEVAWRRVSDLPAEPLPWLLGVARRSLSELRRAQRRRDGLLERIATAQPLAFADPADDLATRDRLLAALNCLSEPQLEVLLLVAWEGLSHREAATVLGCSAPAVALRLHRARARLRNALHETDRGRAPDDAGGGPPVAHESTPAPRLAKETI